MAYPDLLIMQNLVTNLDFLRLYLSTQSGQQRRTLLKNKIHEISRSFKIKQIIQTDYYMSLFHKVMSKSVLKKGQGYHLTTSEILEENTLESVSAIARRAVRCQFIEEAKAVHEKSQGRRRKDNNFLDENNNQREHNKGGQSRNAKEMVKGNQEGRGKKKRRSFFKSLLSNDQKYNLKNLLYNEKVMKNNLKSPNLKSNSLVPNGNMRQALSLSISPKINNKLWVEESLPAKKRLSQQIKQKSIESRHSRKMCQKPLFLNPSITKKFLESNQINKSRLMQSLPFSTSQKAHQSLCINKGHQRHSSTLKVSKIPNKNFKKRTKSVQPNNKKQSRLFPPNFIDWKVELKHSLKIQKSFERLITRGKHAGQMCLNRKSNTKKKKKQIHFYMLKKSNLVGENFVISSVEQNFLLKHIVLFSIVKNNLFYRLTKINFNYTEKDVNIKGKIILLCLLFVKDYNFQKKWIIHSLNFL